jgi:heme/copper-type cytochrome/quinol oxidase subunit 4
MRNKQLILLILSVILTVVCVGTLVFGVCTQNGQLIWSFSFLSILSIIQFIWIGKRYKNIGL